MKARLFSAMMVCCGLVLVATVMLAQAQEPLPEGQNASLEALGTGFTYQGRLLQSGNPLSGTCDMQFTLWNAQTGGTQVGTTETRTALSVSNGLFTVVLDFGATPFAGDARWLEVGVRSPAGSGSYTTLSPRQALTAVPYALYAKTAPWSGLAGVPAGFADGVDNDTTYSAGSGLTLSGTTISADTAYVQRRVSSSCTSGNAIRVVNADGTVTCEPVGGGAGWSLTGNAGTTPGTNYLGTSDDVALELKVNGVRALRLEPHAASPNVIGGYSGNWLTSEMYGATIGGGGYSGVLNRVTDALGTVGGGANNQAGDNAGTIEDATYATVGGGYENSSAGPYATIGGGYGNAASATVATIGGGHGNRAGYAATVGGGWSNSASTDWATVGGGDENVAAGNSATVGGGSGNSASGVRAFVGGGYSNTVSGSLSTVVGGAYNTASGWYGTVGGGYSNTVSGSLSTVAGGLGNTASGDYATVGGGRGNTASGDYSFAAGYAAQAVEDGSFVWSSGGETTESEGINTFTARAHNGVWFFSASGKATGVRLSSGSSSWASVSDRDAKEGFAAVDRGRLLETLAAMPVQSWSLRAQNAAMRHIGPVAQDFNGQFAYLFGQVESPLYINTMDAVGVSLAGVQGLYQLSQTQSARIQQLEAQNAALEGRLAALEAAMAKLLQEQTRGER